MRSLPDYEESTQYCQRRQSQVYRSQSGECNPADEIQTIAFIGRTLHTWQKLLVSLVPLIIISGILIILTSYAEQNAVKDCISVYMS